MHDRSFLTRQEAKAAVIEYIEMFYNSHRRHSTLGYLSPNEFEFQAKVGTEEGARQQDPAPEVGGERRSLIVRQPGKKFSPAASAKSDRRPKSRRKALRRAKRT